MYSSRDHRVIFTYIQYTRTVTVRNFDLVRTVKAVTNRKHLSYGQYVSFSLLRLHLIKDGAPRALTINGSYVSFSSPYRRVTRQ